MSLVVLRAFRIEDADDVAAGCADPVTQRFLPLLPSPYTRADALWWVTEGVRAVAARGARAYALADPHTDRLLGAGGLTPIHPGTAEAGYWVAPWARGRGVARAALRAMVAEAFRAEVHRVELRTQITNTPSQRVAIACGFVREGILRAGGPTREGGRGDRILWSRLVTDPDRPSPRQLPDLPGYGTTAGPALTDAVIRLRPLCLTDLDDTYRLRSLPEAVATSVPPERPARAEVERRLMWAEAEWLAGDRVSLAIRTADADRYAGEIGLYYWNPRTQEAMIGYTLLPEYRGRGFATRAVRLLTEWAFAHTDIARVIAGTLPSNVASQRVLERAGFVREGYQRARLPGPDGARTDDVLFGLVRPGSA
jgi:RimJ/RimL family protein N-acetyltransferase